MSNTVNGDYPTTSAAMFRAFDKLPKSLRERLTESNCDWVPQRVLTAFRQEASIGWTGQATSACLAMLDRWDAEDKAEHFYRLDRMARTGVDYHKQARMRRSKRAKL